MQRVLSTFLQTVISDFYNIDLSITVCVFEHWRQARHKSRATRATSRGDVAKAKGGTKDQIISLT